MSRDSGRDGAADSAVHRVKRISTLAIPLGTKPESVSRVFASGRIQCARELRRELKNASAFAPVSLLFPICTRMSLLSGATNGIPTPVSSFGRPFVLLVRARVFNCRPLGRWMCAICFSLREIAGRYFSRARQTAALTTDRKREGQALEARICSLREVRQEEKETRVAIITFNVDYTHTYTHGFIVSLDCL